MISPSDFLSLFNISMTFSYGQFSFNRIHRYVSSLFAATTIHLYSFDLRHIAAGRAAQHKRLPAWFLF